jgi:hypothetical protein
VSLQFPALLVAGAPRVRFSSSDVFLTEMLSAIPCRHAYYFCQSFAAPVWLGFAGIAAGR